MYMYMCTCKMYTCMYMYSTCMTLDVHDESTCTFTMYNTCTVHVHADIVLYHNVADTSNNNNLLYMYM